MSDDTTQIATAPETPEAKRSLETLFGCTPGELDVALVGAMVAGGMTQEAAEAGLAAERARLEAMSLEDLKVAMVAHDRNVEKALDSGPVATRVPGTLHDEPLAGTGPAEQIPAAPGETIFEAATRMADEKGVTVTASLDPQPLIIPAPTPDPAIEAAAKAAAEQAEFDRLKAIADAAAQAESDRVAEKAAADAAESERVAKEAAESAAAAEPEAPASPVFVARVNFRVGERTFYPNETITGLTDSQEAELLELGAIARKE